MKRKPNRDQRRIITTKSREAFDKEVEQLNERLNEIASNNFVDPDLTDEFSSLPILESTKQALAANKFVKMSPIQQKSLLFTLCGRDLLGSAETGTGKTLAFAIPVIELLKKNKWSMHSGLGAIIISPTRDLASQIYEVFRKLLIDTNLVAGLVTGGLKFDEEQANLHNLNIMIATVGRLKEHIESSATFIPSNLKILVLDEADRLLGTEFIKDLKNMIPEFPKERQTLLFTATATKSLHTLTKSYLQNPAKVILSDNRISATPDNLIQFYTVVPLSEKINYLYSFLKSHRSDKIIVFMETVKLVRYVFEAFRHLKPGLPLLHLTGKQSSDLRFSVCRDFASKDRAVIFTTDVAARGLDFPQVNWVIQMDCPSTTETYIHRVGRTARFFQGGKGLLFLLPSEQKMINKLNEAKVTLKSIQIQQAELINVKPDLVDILAKFSDIKHLAVKAFLTYIKSVKHHADDVFDFQAILDEKDAFAQSLGLLGTPIIEKKKKIKEEKGTNKEKVIVDVANDIPFFNIVEDETEFEADEMQSEKTKPQTLEFIEPDTVIAEEEYHEWRTYLRELLEEPTKHQKKKKPGKKDVQEQAEEEPAQTAEEIAASLLPSLD